MKKIQAILRPYRFAQVQDELRLLGFEDLVVSEAWGFHATLQEARHGRPVHKLLLELIVLDGAVESVIEAIQGNASSGRPGDGNIFVTAVEYARRSRGS
jgi:nitrogen regulatory protein P-II 1